MNIFKELKNDKKITSMIAIVVLVIMLIGASYAFFKSTDALDTNTPLQVTTNTVDSLVFKVDNDISITASPANFNVGMGNQEGETHATATLKANNKTNSATGNYYLYLDITKNELKYTTTDKTAELILQVSGPDGALGAGDISGLDYVTVTDGQGNEVSGFDITTKSDLITIISNYEITTTSEKTDNWDIKVIFVNLESDQNINGGKKFNGQILIQKNEKERLGGTIKRIGKSNYSDEIWGYKSQIKKIVFENRLNPYEEATKSFDISEESSEPVMAYMYKDDSDYYTVYIQADGNIKANIDSSYLFYGFKYLKVIEGIEYIDTSQATNMSNMFAYCSSLTSLDVSGWDTSTVIDMSYMFSNCSSLTSLDLSGWDTGQVTSMHSMFYMYYTYYIQSSLEQIIGIESWNTSQVTDMQSMFSWCEKLIEIDLSNWDTGQVTSMNYMFSSCSSLTSVGDISGWDTSSVTTMSGMFSSCSSLTELNLSGWNTVQLARMDYMFDGCRSLTSIGDVSNWDTSQLTYISWLFRGCSGLTELDLSGWNTSNVTNTQQTFAGCSSLTILDIRSWNTSQVTDNWAMFASVPSTITVYVKDNSAKAFIEARLNEVNGGTVIIAQ